MIAHLESRRRIIVAVDAHAGDLPVEIARHLLGETTTQLVGLYVEDRRLFEHAAAALAREVCYSGHARALERPKLEAHLRARVAEARRGFEASAARHAVTHAFQVLRGDIVAELVREAADADALVVGFTAGAAAASAWWTWALRDLVAASVPTLLVARESWLTGSDVVAVFSKRVDARALDAAVRLACRTRSPLTVLLAADTERERELLSESVRTRLSAVDVELRGVLAVTGITHETIMRVARGARLVVLAHDREPGDTELLTGLAAQTRLALLLVESSGPRH